MSKRPYIIGICGGSASGKSYLLDQLIAAIPPEKLALISVDNYYKPIEILEKDEDGAVNFDHPDTIYLDHLVADVEAVLGGETLIREEYGFNNPNFVPKQLTIRPAPIVIIEGIFVFYPQKLQPMIDLKVFVEAHEHIKLARRLRRDHEDRGYAIKDILSDYEKYVAPMYHQFIAPTKDQCDLIIPNHQKLDVALAVLNNHIQTILRQS